MNIRNVLFRGRQAWEMDNGVVRLVMLKGGGHIAALTHRDRPGLNPLWEPIWKSMEPWKYSQKKHGAQYAEKLLACIGGHNLCLGWFGGVTPEEQAAGMSAHGEAGVSKWRLIRKRVSRQALTLAVGCTLPAAQMEFRRTLTLKKGRTVIRVRETVRSTACCDRPYTMCQHVTLGPPFLEKGVTVFDMPATKGHTFLWPFEKTQRMKQNAAFVWPKGPGIKGKAVDLRTIGREFKRSSDFSTQLMDVKRADAWFSALNPAKGLLLAYVWNRADYPWVGNWEENFGRKRAPWAGKSLTRGMEFSNTPFPVTLRQMVEMNKFQGQPTYRWLAAKSMAQFDYDILLVPVSKDAKGTKNITRTKAGLIVELV